jgi:4-amino-4-deoxy-L-arabinose transferase-like glycosyltransferase
MTPPVNRILALAVLLGLTLALYFQGLGSLPFYTVGEPREALEIWEEVHNGEWILPSRNGIDLPSKPPLFHWLGGLTALATGTVDEFAARFPSALLATVTVFLVYWCGARKWGTAAGMFAACMLATNFEWIRAARSARVDIVLTTFLTGAFIAFEPVATAAIPRPLPLLLFYLCMGLATLAKGPIGFLLPGFVAVVYLGLRRDLGRLRRLHVFPGCILAVGLPGCWYLAATLHGGMAFVHKQLLIENLMTFFGWTSDPGTPSHSFFYVIPSFFTGFAPWSLFVVPLGIFLYQLRGRHLDDEGYLYPLVWFVAIFLFFMVAAGKRTVYLLPLYPAAALLLGAWWGRLNSGQFPVRPGLRTVLRIGTAVFAIALLCILFAVALEAFGASPLDRLGPFLHHTDRENLPLVHDMIRAYRTSFLCWAGVVAASMLLVTVATWRGRWAVVFASLVVLVASTTLLVNTVFHPELAERRTFKPFMAAVRVTLGDSGQLAFYDSFDYGAVFYWQQRIPVLGAKIPAVRETDRRRYLLLWESEWNGLSAQERGKLDLVLRSEGTGPDARNRLVLARVLERP